MLQRYLESFPYFPESRSIESENPTVTQYFVVTFKGQKISEPTQKIPN